MLKTGEIHKIGIHRAHAVQDWFKYRLQRSFDVRLQEEQNVRQIRMKKQPQWMKDFQQY